MPQIAIDRSLIDPCTARDWPALLAALTRLAAAGDIEPAFADKLVPHLQSLDEPALAGLALRADHLATNAGSAVTLLSDVLPDRVRNAPYPLSVMLLPATTISFSPCDRRQVFGIADDAHPQELLWFFAHVVFHELTVLGYTDRCRCIAARRKGYSDEVYWLKLLIRNEGIGNFPFLEKLSELRAESPDLEIRYFTYADWIGRSGHLAASVECLISHLDSLRARIDDRGDTAGMLKRNVVPAINLIGIAMASAIAGADGTSALKDHFAADPEAFFLRYDQICRQDDALVPLRRSLWDTVIEGETSTSANLMTSAP